MEFNLELLNMVFNITCNTDNNYAQHCCAMLCSLFDNNKDHSIIVHVLTKNLSEINKTAIHKLGKKYAQNIIFHEVDETILEGVQFRKKRPLTKAAYYRILLPTILSQDIDKVLYIDCDMIILSNISDLFKINISSYSLAACKDVMPYNSIHRKQLNFEMSDSSFCSGIMMINLKYWRDNNSQEKLLEFAKKPRNPIFLHDQDALNYLFKKTWFSLSPVWNKTTMAIAPLNSNCKFNDCYDYMYHPKILHYASDLKPWFNISFPQSHYYRYYLKLSEYPSPTFIKLSAKNYFFSKFKCVRYYLNAYIRPIIPTFIELLIFDIFNLFKILFFIVTGKTGELKALILSIWLFKNK